MTDPDPDVIAAHAARQADAERADARATLLLKRVLIGAGLMFVVWAVAIFIAFDGSPS
ncbi:MAG: hypothetical protein JWM98_1697 [Thermoleophilia bacterium]|nr:hypothetical protein [Thermoleophilia bacterium]